MSEKSFRPFVIIGCFSIDSFSNDQSSGFNSIQTLPISIEQARNNARDYEQKAIQAAEQNDISKLRRILRQCCQGDAPPLYMLPQKVQRALQQPLVQKGLTDNRGSHSSVGRKCIEEVFKINQGIYISEEEKTVWSDNSGSARLDFNFLSKNPETTDYNAIKSFLLEQYPAMRDEMIETKRLYRIRKQKEMGGRLYYTGPTQIYKNGIWQLCPKIEGESSLVWEREQHELWLEGLKNYK